MRDAIKRIGGTMPEKIPPAEHIKQVKKRIKSIKPRLQLDEQDAKGLVAGQNEKNNTRKKGTMTNNPAPIFLINRYNGRTPPQRAAGQARISDRCGIKVR